MKCEIVITPKDPERVVLYVREPNAGAEALADKINHLLENHPPELMGYTEKEIVRIRPESVCCFSSEGGRVYAITQGERLLMKQRLYELEALLGDSFMKINQSCIANIEKIERFDTSFGGSLMVCFKNGHRDYVSRRQLKFVKERMGFKL